MTIQGWTHVIQVVTPVVRVAAWPACFVFVAVVIYREAQKHRDR